MEDRKLGVVIADDEEKICRLIATLGEWEAFNMEIAGTASNGQEALNILSEKTVDLLITDIRMPGISGIELIEKALSISPATRFIIISGYAEFEYAQKALHIGVEDYLLKPVNKDQLNNALKKIYVKLVGEEAKEQEIKRKDELLRSMTSTLRSTLIQELLMDSSIRPDKDKLSEKYDLQFTDDTYRFICIKLDVDIREAQENAGEDFLWDKVAYILSDQLQGVCDEPVLYLQKHCLYGVLNYDLSRDEDLKKALRNVINQFGSLKGIFREGSLYMAVSDTVKYPEDLGKALLSSQKAIKERLIKGEGKLLTGKGESSALNEKKLLEIYERNMSAAIENLDEEGLLSAAKDLKAELLKTEGISGYEIFSYVHQAGEMLVRRIDLSDKRERFALFYETMDNCGKTEELFEAFEKFSSVLIGDLIEAKEDDTVRAIRQAKIFLQNHYTEQITLEEVSDRLGLSAPYFSSLFKKETGTGFARYLMGLRVEAAKDLLRESNMSVAEICRSVGYNDVKHFTKNFEQSVGIKPAVYRKLYG